MSSSHLKRLKNELEKNHWRINEENSEITEFKTLYWKISRPNGDCPLTLNFSPGHTGKHYDILIETIDGAIACDIEGHNQLDYLYFSSKYQGKFQQDVIKFVQSINQLEKDVT